MAYSVPQNIATDYGSVSYFPASSQTYGTPTHSLPVSVRYGDWFDASRNRRVPVKVYLPAAMLGKSPVVVFSHGLGGSREKCEYLGQKWASAGFVSVAIQHIGIDEDIWKRKIRPIKELKDVYSRHWSGRMQADDIRFVLDQLETLAAFDASFAQRLDMNRVGVAGYDLGGLATMLVAGQLPPDQGPDLRDLRVKAIVVMSPPVFSHISYAPSVYRSMQSPALFFTGTDDNGWIGTTKSWQRRIPFDYMQGNDRFLVTYQGADHMIYGGHIRTTKSRDDQKYQDNIAQVSTLFWQAYLREEPAMLAYFQGPTLGHVAGTLGQVERRLGQVNGQANGMPIPQPNIVENRSTIRQAVPVQGVQTVPDFRQQTDFPAGDAIVYYE